MAAWAAPRDTIKVFPTAAVTDDGQLVRQDIFGPVALHASGRIVLLSAQLEAGLRSRAQQPQTGGREAGGVTSALSVSSPLFESPLRRFTRLSDEVRGLQEELQVVAAADAAAQQRGADPVNRGGMWDALMQGTRSLQEQLVALAPSLAAGQVAGAAAGADDAGWFDAARSRLLSVAAAADAPPPVSADATALSAEQPSSGSGHEELLLLDSRLAALEALLLPAGDAGEQRADVAARDRAPADNPSSSISADAGGGVVGRLDALEAVVARLVSSPQALADAEARALALRQTQAAVAGSAPSGSVAPAPGFVVVEERVLRAVEALERWDAWAPALPVLAARLATLERIHRDSALFTQRLALAEAALGTVTAQLDAGVGLVAEAQDGLRAAAADMAENVRVIEAAVGRKCT